MVIFEIDAKLSSAVDFVAALEAQGVATLPISPTKIRMVTHLDVSAAQIRQAAAILAASRPSTRQRHSSCPW